MTQLATAKKVRPKRLTRRQQIEVEKFYPMARAIGNEWAHRDADGDDRAHDFIIGVISKMRSRKSRAATPKGFARIDGLRGIMQGSRRYKLVHMPAKAYKEADEATRARNRSHVSLDPTSLLTEDQDDDDAYAEVRAALRRLDPLHADILERLHVRDQRPVDVARALGVSISVVEQTSILARSFLRNDREVCRLMGEESFFDLLPPVPRVDPPNRGGMRAAAAFLRLENGQRDVAILRLLLKGGPRSVRDLAELVPCRESSLASRVMPRIASLGFARRATVDGTQVYSVAAKGRRLLDACSRLQEWEAEGLKAAGHPAS